MLQINRLFLAIYVVWKSSLQSICSFCSFINIAWNQGVVFVNIFNIQTGIRVSVTSPKQSFNNISTMILFHGRSRSSCLKFCSPVSASLWFPWRKKNHNCVYRATGCSFAVVFGLLGESIQLKWQGTSWLIGIQFDFICRAVAVPYYEYDYSWHLWSAVVCSHNTILSIVLTDCPPLHGGSISESILPHRSLSTNF